MAVEAREILGAVLLWALALASAPVSAGEVACPDPRVRVEADSAALRERVCGEIERLRPSFAACGLEQGRQITLLVVSGSATDPHDPSCIGSYDCGRDEIRVLHPEALPQAVGPDSPLARLSAGELFDSLIAHELAHAFFAQSEPGGEVRPFVDQEYVAYAMQMASLDEAARARLLEAHAGMAMVDRIELNGIVALAAPTLFAAKAWRHFSSPGNGCAFVERLIRGEVTLSLAPL
jgi:hypothetical protein